MAAMKPARHTADTITDAALDQLYAERDMHGREADRLRKDWVTMRARAEQAEAAAEQQARHLRTLSSERDTYRQWWKYEEGRRAYAERANARARKLAEDWAVLRTHGSAAYELRAALEEPASDGGDSGA